MYAVIQDGIIYHERGDSLRTPIKIFNGTLLSPEKYELSDDDELYFAIIEPNHSFEGSIIRKKYVASDEKDSDGNTILKLNPEDTEKLMTGLYYYTLKIKQGINVHTLIQMTPFYITGTNPPVKSECTIKPM